jgi:hypothetical protein
MKILSIFLLIISIILVIVSSWNLSIFIHLNNYQLEKAYNVSKKYVNNGKKVSIIVLIISIIFMISSSFTIFFFD